MKRLLLILLLKVCIGVAQTDDSSLHFEILNNSLVEQLKYELKSSNYSERNVYLMYTPLVYKLGGTEESLLINEFKSVGITYLSKKDLKKASRKGVSYLKVYPFKLDDDGAISLLIEMIYLKKKEQTIVGSNTYRYKFSCENQKFELFDKT